MRRYRLQRRILQRAWPIRGAALVYLLAHAPEATAAMLGGPPSAPSPDAGAQSIAEIPPVWISQEDGIGALFPIAPERIAAEQANVVGHAFQAVKEYDSCVVLYTLTVIPNLPGEHLPPSGLSWGSYFRQLSFVFADSIGVPRSALILKEGAFGRGTPILHLEYPVKYKGISLRAKAFWVAGKRAVFRVSATQAGTPNSEARNEIDRFLRYVTLLEK